MRAEASRVPCSARKGFTLLEAAVAMTIIGMVAVGALGAFGAELRVAARASDALPAAALAEERLARLELADTRRWMTLPESLTAGTFEAPFSKYEWRASLNPVRDETGLYEMAVTVQWPAGSYTLARRRFRPAPDGLPLTDGTAP